MASALEAHDAWLQVISNIPYCNYRQMIDGITGQTTRSEADKSKGYIVIPENERNNTLLDWLNNNGYQVSGADQYCYEIRASLRNIIIALDHLLQLNLFTQAGGLEKEFMRPDFIATYFPKLCVVLKATGFLSTQENAGQGEVNKNFDALDYTDKAIYTTLELSGIICEFKTYSGHGELRLVKSAGVGEERAFMRLLQKITNFTNQPSLSLLVTNLLCRQEINFGHLKNNPEYVYVNLFAVSLENTGVLQDIINMSSSITRYLKPMISIKDLLLRLAEKQPDMLVKQQMKLRILRLFVQGLDNDDITTGGIDIINSVKEVVQAAEKGIIDPNWRISNPASSLFRALFAKNQGFKEAIQVAEKGITDPDPYVRSTSVGLFEDLFEKDQGFKEAIQVAEKGIIVTDPNTHVRYLSSSSLFAVLFAKDQGFKEAIQVAEKGITDPDFNVRRSALILFKDLVAKDQGFDKATQAAEKAITDPEHKVRDSALTLFKDLVNKNQEFDKAIQAAEKGITDSDLDVRSSAVKLFKQLIIKASDETKKVIQKFLGDSNLKLADDVRQELVELLKK